MPAAIDYITRLGVKLHEHLEGWGRKDVPLYELNWDVEGVLGQQRKLNMGRVAEMQLSIRQVPLQQKLEPLLWRSNEGLQYHRHSSCPDGKLYVLGRQHITAALNAERRRCIKEKLEPPEYGEVVAANILKASTPLLTRLVLAADDNTRTHNVQRLPVYDMAAKLLAVCNEVLADCGKDPSDVPEGALGEIILRALMMSSCNRTAQRNLAATVHPSHSDIFSLPHAVIAESDLHFLFRTRRPSGTTKGSP